MTGNTFNTLRSIGMNFYIQDDIHVVPRLLLNVGMRYEYNSPRVEDHNRFSVPDLSANSATCTPVPDCQFIQAGTNGIPRATYTSDAHRLRPAHRGRLAADEERALGGALGVRHLLRRGHFQYQRLAARQSAVLRSCSTTPTAAPI